MGDYGGLSTKFVTILPFVHPSYAQSGPWFFGPALRTHPLGVTILHMPGNARRLGEFALIRSSLVRALLTSAALAAVTVLSGCNTDTILPMSDKAARPLSG